MTSSAVVRLLEDADDVGDVPRKGAERLLDGLLVADVGVDVVEQRQLRAGLDRDVQPRLRHGRHQPDGLERDGLAAGVGAGDDQREGARREVDIQRHDGVRIEQRMPRLEQADDDTGVGSLRVLCVLRDVLTRSWFPFDRLFLIPIQRMQQRLAGVDLLGILGLGKGQVQLGQRFDAGDDLAGRDADLRGQFRQHLAHFVAFGQLQFAEGVVHLDDRQRFDEQGRAARRLVVDDGLDLSLELGAQRDDIAPVALGDERILQHRHGLAVGDVLLQAAHQPFVGDAHVAAQAGQFDGGRVEHFALVRDGARDGIDDAGRVGQAERQPADARELRLHFFEGLLQLAAGDQRGLDIQQVGGIQHAAVPGQVHLLADVVRAADGQVVQRRAACAPRSFPAGGRVPVRSWWSARAGAPMPATR